MIGLIPLMLVFGLVMAIFFGIYNIFEKAGEPGWQAFIPFYNIYRLFKVAGLPGGWMLGLFIPFVNLFIYFMLGKSLAERFDRSPGFAVGVVLLPWIFLPMLGYSDAQYTPPADFEPYRPMSEYDRSAQSYREESPRRRDDEDDDQDGIERIPLEDW